MRRPDYSGQFKHDVKQARKRGKDMDKLKTLLGLPTRSPTAERQCISSATATGASPPGHSLACRERMSTPCSIYWKMRCWDDGSGEQVIGSRKAKMRSLGKRLQARVEYQQFATNSLYLGRVIQPTAVKRVRRV